MTRGILLIALGHQNYRDMAINLAVSLKYNEPDIKIALATDTLKEERFNGGRGLIDRLVYVPQEMYEIDGKRQYIKAKTHMYDLSPFEETIFLDVDMIVLMNRKISVLFDTLKKLDWTMANTGIAEVSMWAKIDDVKAAYKTNRDLWNYHSEFVYFKKKDKVKKYFDKVKEVYCNPITDVTDFAGGNMADELAFQIASMLLNYYPHKKDFTPTYWWARSKDHLKLYPYQLPKHFFTYSIGGNHLPNIVKSNYNNLASYYFTQMKLQRPYQATDKRSFLKERINL